MEDVGREPRADGTCGPAALEDLHQLADDRDDAGLAALGVGQRDNASATVHHVPGEAQDLAESPHRLVGEPRDVRPGLLEAGDEGLELLGFEEALPRVFDLDGREGRGPSPGGRA